MKPRAGLHPTQSAKACQSGCAVSLYSHIQRASCAVQKFAECNRPSGVDSYSERSPSNHIKLSRLR